MTKKRVRLAVCGAGSRGVEAYGHHALNSPYDVEFTAVAEPREAWRERAIKKLRIPRENAFTTWEELAERPQLADGIFVTTQDQMHVGPACAFMRKAASVAGLIGD